MTLLLRDHEETHRKMLRVHSSLRDAHEIIHAVATEIYQRSQFSDARREAKPVLEKIERARDLIAEALFAAGDGRSELVRATGCNNSCSEKQP